MAVDSLYSDQEPSSGAGVYGNRLYAFDSIGKLRFSRFSYLNDATVHDVTSTINLCRIPQGRVRVLPWLSYVWCNAWGAARTLDFGFRAYIKSDGVTVQAEDGTQVKATKDLSAALAASQIDTAEKIDFFSQASSDDKTKGPMLFGTVRGDTLTATRTLNGFLAYMQN